MNILLGFGLLLCIIPNVFCLECYECANGIPGMPGTSCKSADLPKRTCGPMEDHCQTLKADVKSPDGSTIKVTMRNCSMNMTCTGQMPNAPSAPCAGLNTTGFATSCSSKCCAGDLCDPFMVPTSTPALVPTSVAAAEPASVSASAGETPPTVAAKETTPTSGARHDVTCFGGVFVAIVLLMFLEK